MEILCEFSLVAIKVRFCVSHHVVTLMSTVFVLHCLLKRVQDQQILTVQCWDSLPHPSPGGARRRKTDKTQVEWILCHRQLSSLSPRLLPVWISYSKDLLLCIFCFFHHIFCCRFEVSVIPTALFHILTSHYYPT